LFSIDLLFLGVQLLFSRGVVGIVDFRIIRIMIELILALEKIQITLHDLDLFL